MDTPMDRAEFLDPHPSMIVKFIQGVTEKSWPSAANQYDNYFAHLGCELESADEPDDEGPLGVTQGVFATPRFTTKNASWIALDGSLFGLNFFTYEDEREVPAAVDAGYEGVRTGLSGLYGQSPDERTDQRGNSSAVWMVEDTLIEVYAHVTQAPVLQIGLGHRERSATYEQLVAETADKPKSISTTRGSMDQG